MAEITWNKEQTQAINEKGSNLLVAAAAGSGKTTVLVERIIRKIINEKMDIDKLLVVTFTNAAASEMRERILNAIYKKIEEEPNDIHLQKQITLLNKASICTIHSFCLDVIRNYFYEIDVPANFQIGDSTEMELLKQEALDEVLEEKYAKKEESFLQLVDAYASYRGDEDLKELVLNIYKKIQSHPFPKQWLDEKVEMFNFSDKMEQDISKTIWGKILLEELQEQLKENRLKLAEVESGLRKYPELQKYALTITSDEERLEAIENLIKENATWNQIHIEMQNLKFEKWPGDKKITIDYKDQAKDARDKIKKTVNNLKTKIIMDNSQEANKAINAMYPILLSLKELVFEFEKAYSAKKRERNSIDFNDIEHFALSILIKQKENGEIEPSSVAKELQEKFEEIAIDEYQDSNLVQEYILNSVSKQNNIFMVGDIKQSIYRFREAKPELFLEKYKKYELVKEGLPQQEKINAPKGTDYPKGNVPNGANGQKIKLFQNFRSRKEVLNLCNWVFEQIMSEELGDVEYNEEEYLNPGANYEEAQNMLPELHILDLEKEEKQEEIDFQEYENSDSDEDDLEEKEEIEEETQIIEKTTEEAKMVANLIEKLFKQGFMVQDKKQGKRKIQYKDIVILLRSTKIAAPIYEKELTKKQFPVFCDTSSQYLEAEEVQTILALLKVMDNPLQDIELVQVLRSPIGNFTDNDLVEIRLADAKGYFYEAMLKKRLSAEENLKNKIDTMLNSLEEWRQLEKELPLNELIWKIYSDTNYYNYVGLLSNGALRQANLKMLFERAKQYEAASFKGLYHFIHFMDRLHINNSDLSSAKIVGENDNVIRIMSIHKSKGLEFPVVFVCNTGKQFNKQDLSDTILLHSELGFGPKYINRDENIQYSTVAKDAIKLQLEKELIAEEMRVLYVALTRAKEKLIITGTTKNYEKYNQKIEDLLTLYKQVGKGKIEQRLLKKHTSYLDWFMFLILKEKEQNKITYQVHKLKENQKENQEQQEEIKEMQKTITGKEEEIKEIQKQLEWQYPHLISSQIPSKTSVSKIKEEKQQESEEVELIELLGKKEYTMNTPNFTNKEAKNIPSNRKGTLVHLCLQKLDSSKEYTERELQDLIEELVKKEIILQEEAEAIPITALSQYLKSNIWKELKEAKEIHKEEPFYMQIPANRVNENYPKEENILLQGVMDLYYINKNDELILVDYKTDYVKQGDEQKLIEKYKEQLSLYQEALEKALNRKVDKVIIYSTWLGEIRMR